MKGLYIHIPFCISKCPYCDFNSYAGKMQYVKQYIESLILEATAFKEAEIQTVYIGGGTPTCLEKNDILYLFECINKNFKLMQGAEITIEANPATIDKDKLKSLKDAGINRISIGVQSFDSGMLKALGRIHSANDARRAVNDARLAGFDNISIDLMFSLPGQTLETWAQDLRAAVSLDISHISCYGLKIEQGTPFYSKNIKPLNEELDRAMYLAAIELLDKNGFEQYEISNFARDKKYSKHNLCYWKCKEYIGLGAGAHSYTDGERYSNTKDLCEYIQKIRRGQSVKENSIILTERDVLVEQLIMGMRLCEGVNKSIFEKLNCQNKIKKYTEAGYMVEKNGKIAFSVNGFDVSNYILSDLI